MSLTIPLFHDEAALIFWSRVEDHVAGLVELDVALLPDLRPDLLDLDGSAVNLRDLLTLLPHPGLEPGDLTRVELGVGRN